MKKFLSILLCIITVLSLCACDVNSGNDFIMGVYGTITSFDPVKAENDAEKIISANCFESLLRFDENGNINLAGATAYTMQKDGLKYTFKLNPNAQWHITNETKTLIKEKNIKSFNKIITAQDYVFGFEHFKNVYKDKLTNVTFKATDKHTLELHLMFSDPDLLYKLACLPIFPLNEAFFNATKETYGKDFNTTLFNGPYHVTSSSVSETIIEKNSVYNGNIQIHNKKILLYTTGTEELMNSRYDNGTYNVFIGNDWHPLAGENAKFISTNKVWGLAFNCKSKVGSVQNLRSALLSALDFTSVTIPDFASATAQGLIPDSFIAGDKKYGEFTHESYKYPQNKDGAVSTFEKALKKQGETICRVTLAVPEEMKAAGESIASQWKTLFAGKIEVTLLNFKAKEAEAFAKEGKYDVAILHLMPENKTANSLLDSITNAPCYYEDSSRASAQPVFSTVASENIETYNKIETKIIKKGIFIPLFCSAQKLYLKENTSGIYLANGGEFIYFYKGVQE